MKSKRSGHIISFVVIFAICLVLEATVFQYRFYQPVISGAKAVDIPLDSVTSGTGAVSDGKTLTVKGDASLTFDVKDTPVTCVELITGQDAKYSMTVKWHDEGNSVCEVTGDQKVINRYTPNQKVYYMTSQGNCSDMVIEISSYGAIKISGIRLNRPPFCIRWLRVIAAAVLIFAVRLTVLHKPWKKTGEKYNSDLTKIVAAIFLLLMLSVFVLSPGYETNTEHCSLLRLFYSQPDVNDPYMMQTDAFANGRISLDIDVDEKLTGLSNPYDDGARSGISYKWDFAYYNGKYYSYFGVVPIILVLLPIRLITGKFLSSYIFAFLLNCCAAVALAELYRRLICRYIPGINRFAYTAGLIATLFGSMLIYPTARSWFYEIPYAGGMLCTFCSLILLLSAAETGQYRRRRLIFSGLLFGLAVGCRPVFILSAVIMLPIYIEIMKQSDKKITNTACLVSPAAVVGVLLAVYNFVRFGSFTEFGASYQLTVSDIRYNSLTDIPALFESTGKYLFSRPTVDAVFPFVHLSDGDFAVSARKAYDNPVLGLLSYPIVWAAVLFPLIRRKETKRVAVGFAVYTVLCIIMVGCTAGIMQRYVLDFQWAAMLMSVVTGLSVINDRANLSSAANAVFALVCAVTVALALPVCFMGEYGRVEHTAPQIFYLLKNTFEIIY